jgi:hypothetical protein
LVSFHLLKRGERIISAQICGFNAAYLVYCVAQNRLVGLAGSRNPARGVVGSFLQQVARMSTSPFPMDFVSRCSAIESLPPGQVGLAPEAPIHRLDNVSRISKDTDLARLFQRFEPDRRRRNFSLLICRFA